jgi:hypothetical protein
MKTRIIKRANLVVALSFLLSACGGSSSQSSLSEEISQAPPVTNLAPTANDDSVTTKNGQSVTINVLDNDSDSDNDTLSISSVTEANNGIVELSNGQVIYTPDSPSFAGNDSFSYQITDGQTSATAQVNIEIYQSIQFIGKVVGLSTNNRQVEVNLGPSAEEAALNSDGSFRYDFQSDSTPSGKLSFDLVSEGRVILSSLELDLTEVVKIRGTGDTFDVSEQQSMNISPVSTAIEALKQRLQVDDIQDLELQLDTGSLLQLAAIATLVADGSINHSGNILDLILNDEALENAAQSLLGADEETSREASSDDNDTLLVTQSAALEQAIGKVRADLRGISPFQISEISQSNNSVLLSGMNDLKLNFDEISKQNAPTLLSYYEISPGYQGRVASYDLSGEKLELREDGTGTYASEFDSSELIWEEVDGSINVELVNPARRFINEDLFSLVISGLISQQFYDDIDGVDFKLFAKYDVFINSFSVSRLFDGETVEFVTNTFDLTAEAIENNDYYDEAVERGLASIPITEITDAEFRDASLESQIAFTSDEIVGSWGAVIASTELRHSSENNIETLSGTFPDLVSFESDGSFTSEVFGKSGTWLVADDGRLIMNQNDGWSISLFRLNTDDIASSVIARAEGPNQEFSSTHRMLVKQEIESFDLNQINDSDVLWQASWSLSNPNNYNADGSLKPWGYFGFQFDQENLPIVRRLSYVYLLSDTIEIETRNAPRFLRQDGDKIVLERRYDNNSAEPSSECDLSELSCNVFIERHLIPLAQTENRFFALQHFYVNTDRIFAGNEDKPLYFSPTGNVLFYEKTPYPDSEPGF